MSKFSRPCLVCGTLSKQTRCPKHTAEINSARELKRDTPERRAKKAALYNGEYHRRRKELLAVATHCHLCKKAFLPTDRVEADHLIPGIADSPLAAAHRLCNQQRGNKPL
jgi:hypothetical protein